MEQLVNSKLYRQKPSPHSSSPALFPDHHEGNSNLCQQAVGTFRRCLNLKESNPQIWNQVGEALQEQGLWDKAEVSFRQAILHDPDCAEAWSNLSLSLMSLKRIDESLEACRQALKLNPSLPSAHNHLGMAFLYQQKLSEAEAACSQALKLSPGYPEGLVTLAIVRTVQERLEEAEYLLGEALTAKPGWAEALANRAEVRCQQNRLHEALTDLSQAEELKPWLSGIYVLKARVQMARQDKQEAAEAVSCARVLASQPWSAASQTQLGDLLRKQGKLELAIASYRRALAIQPDCAMTYNNLGNALRDQEKLEEAMASYRQAVAIDPEMFQSHYNLAALLSEKHQWEEAIAAFQRTLALKPDLAEAHKGLGDIFLKQEKPDEAITAYQSALALKPDWLEAIDYLAAAYLAKGWYDKAQALFQWSFQNKFGLPPEKAARFDPANPVGTDAPECAYATPFQLIDRIDQLRYLLAKGKIDPSFQELVVRLEALLQEVQTQPLTDVTAGVRLSQEQLAPLAGYWEKSLYWTDAPCLKGSVLNDSLDYQAIEDSYLASPAIYFDDFLTPEALNALRQFCFESTIFFRRRASGYVGTYMHEGFNCSLLYQIAAELKQRLPRILGPLPPIHMWAYRYQSRGSGIKPHTGDASVTLNFWFTPDEANLGPKDGGGLVIYKQALSPDTPDSEWLKFNVQKDEPEIQSQIGQLIESAESMTVPYRCNRAVLFQSNLWHRSDPFHFQEGFENRRMNGVMLFGHRGKEGELSPRTT